MSNYTNTPYPVHAYWQIPLRLPHYLLRLCWVCMAGLLWMQMATAQNVNTRNKTGPMGTQVNTYTGNLFTERTDMVLPGVGMDIDITFSYNSVSFEEDQGFGNGWEFAYAIRYQPDTLPGSITIIMGDGKEITFDSLPGGNYRSPAGFFNRLTSVGPGQFVVTEKDSTRYFFMNPQNRRCTRMEDPNGNYLTMQYTDTLLTAIENRDGQKISLQYNAEGRVSAITDEVTSPARTYAYTYDTRGNLTRVTNPLGFTYQYTYLVNGPMKTMQDRNQNKIDIIYFPDFRIREIIGCNKRISFSYDATRNKTIATDHFDDGSPNQVTTYTYEERDGFGWLVEVEGNCCGFDAQYTYDNDGNTIEERDANGNITRFTYDSRGNVLSMTDPLGQITLFTWSDNFNQLTSLTDPKGNRYEMSYDTRGNLTELKEPDGDVYRATYNSKGEIVSSTDPRGNSYQYTYDAVGNPAKVTGPENYEATLQYDARGNLLAFANARNHTITAEYDILNRLRKIIDPENKTIEMKYDAEDNLTQLKDRNSQIYSLEYDASNRLATLKDPFGKQASFGYTAMDKVSRTTNFLGHTTTFSYDTKNRLKQLTNAAGETTQLDRDGNGNITSLTLPNGNHYKISYDALDRIREIGDSMGILASLQYDANSNITSFTNATGATFSYIYDAENRVTGITDPLGLQETIEYNEVGNIIATTDRAGKKTTYRYDDKDRLLQVTDPKGFTVTIGYDAEDNITRLTDQNGNQTDYTFDPLNRRTTMTYANGSSETYQYDANGNLTHRTLTDGTTILYGYDAMNRMTQKTLPDGEVFTYAYDAQGRVTSAANATGTVQFAYDAVDRLIEEKFDDRVVAYQYDVPGRTQTTTYPDGSKIVKLFDARDRLTSIEKNGQPVVQYAYNEAGQLVQRNFGNGVQTRLQYDFANRLNSLVTADGQIQNTRFEYDDEQNKTLINRLNDPALSEQFTYDENYRLTNYKRGQAGGTENSYTYDNLGNRTAANLNGTATNYGINSLNQIISRNGTPLTYDVRGNMTFDGKFYKTYDAENRLRKDSASPSEVFNYYYDAVGRRVIKQQGAQTLHYTYSGAMQIEEHNTDKTLRNKTVYAGILEPVMQESEGIPYYYHPNEMGSVEAISHANGRPVETYLYDAFGKLQRRDSLGNTLPASIAQNRIGFTGQEYDEHTGTYRFYYRNYSPELGIFQQRDLIEYEDGMGMYQYVGNNPANGVDVWGLENRKGSCKLTFEGNSYEHDLKILKLGMKLEFTTKGSELLELATNAIEVFSKADVSTLSNVGKWGGKASPFLGIAESGIKAGNAMNLNRDPNSQYMDRVDANWDAASSATTTTFGIGALITGLVTGAAAGPVVAGAATGAAIFGIADAGLEAATGKNTRKLTEPAFLKAADNRAGRQGFNNWLEANNLMDEVFKIDNHHMPPQLEKTELYDFLYHVWDMGKGPTYLKMKRKQAQNACDPGSRRKPKKDFDPVTKKLRLVEPVDPNEIFGPDGIDTARKWVSVSDRMPYTIMFENDTTASAPAKFVRISTNIEPKQDPGTFELSTFGFNNQSFSIPPGQATWFERLDCRDSANLFVDLVAGYDPLSNQAFWEFRSIDPNTLLPTEEPLAGFLFLQDTTQPNYGHGFVNFSIRPRTTSLTGDTIGAQAEIVFDIQDTIPTNVWVNTIDAFPPTSRLDEVTVVQGNTVYLRWSGEDDPGGVGLEFYSIYISENGTDYSLLVERILRNDTTLTLPPNGNYCLFVIATDSVGNAEPIDLTKIACVAVGNVLPVSWLYFTGINKETNNHLKWATTNEQNTKEFILERSINDNRYNEIARINAAGNSTNLSYYEYMDYNIDKLNSEVFYYRLRQIDKDGKFSYSSVVKINYKHNKKPSIVYPNPTRDKINIAIGDQKLLETEGVLMDQNGRILMRVTMANPVQQIDISSLAAGLYFFQLRNGEILKIIKQQ